MKQRLIAHITMYGVAMLVVCGPAPDASAQWISQPSGTTARLRGLSAVDPSVAWASGTEGTVLRTTNGGHTWVKKDVPESSTRDFRDIEAFDERTAYLLSIGEGDRSRIFKTTDGGATWRTQHVNVAPDGFLDALAFWDSEHGLALGDPVDGRFVVLATDDGGRNWKRIPSEGIPPALPGEGAFAASGTCLVVQGSRNAWFGTGRGRVFRSNDGGRSWTAHATPIRSVNTSAGIFSLAFRDEDRGVAVGGDYKEPARRDEVAALTFDGGRTWRLPKGAGPRGYRSAVAMVRGSPETVVAVGPTGADWSLDGGETWEPFGDLGFHAFAITKERAGWGVGDSGRIGRFGPGRAGRSP